ncbi:MAG: aminotransferase class I/II-fold pyridoxal phosphate-dependent enzyme [Pseudomonadota bacterium]|uniref:Aminotransferase class I/II-fold pyridoxal phosphate-dependent enzyme n=1 Tax=Pseudoalteromonas spongiae TaxID=298657 RepID=A0ABU8ESC2_9GAMM|nr:aminotransferase class I/II-fold pyridoxal phosphate-dependent enzyme [Pseudoalteromonas spongiae]ATC99122.1 methionine-gamma-lyase [Pseudoalteromonas spongiae UST010723-006]MEC8324898.1 aminotransferase class I/II-fold pyridoxal phosphate-dependent enzyme [Pseudomonadota bacterium]
MKSQLSDNSLCIHGGKQHDHAHGPLSTPIYQSSTFVFDNAAQGAARFAGDEAGYIYSRLGNPTTRELELKIAALEEMEDGAATATGMGAVSASVLSFLAQGDHLIASKAVYGCTFALFSHMLPKFGIEVTFVDMEDHNAVENALKPNTKMIFAETPINPNLVVIDLAFIGDFAKRHNLISVIDNTFMTPLLQKPKHFGIDIVLHSATKYLNGHGDVVAGLVCGSKEHIETIKLTVLKDIGATISPHDAWLIIRGMKTLSVRMERHCNNAQKVAEFLAQHEKIEQVYYPGLKSHPGNKFIGTQMKAAGGVIAFELKGTLEMGAQFINATKLCTLAVSLGDAETLIQHPASMTHSPYTPEERLAAGISDGLVRISVGLEEADDIIDDLAQALAQI